MPLRCSTSTALRRPQRPRVSRRPEDERSGCRQTSREREQVFAAVDEVRRRLGPPRILVNNAGMGATFKRFLDVSPDVWERVLQVNLTGAFHCCQAVLPDMVEARWGRIVNISSSSAHSGQALLGPYVSSKSGLNGLTKTLALEFGSTWDHRERDPPGFHRHPDAAGIRSEG